MGAVLWGISGGAGVIKFMSGFAALHREATEHPLFDGDVARFGAWFWLVANACWKSTKHDINGKIITLKRGQICVSRTRLAKAWGWSPSAVERFLTRLQTEQMIGRATGQGKSVITILNYEKYQDIKQETGQATGQATGQRSDSDRTTKEQGNQRREESPLPPKAENRPEKQKKYAFSGRTIRLTQQDFDRWKESYHAIKDLRAELQAIDDWFELNVPEAQRGNWFVRVSNNLRRKHDEGMARKKEEDEARRLWELRYPERQLSDFEAKALMKPDEYERWKERQA